MRSIFVFCRFPAEDPFPDDIVKTRHQQSQKDQDLYKSKPPKLFKVYGPGVKKNDFHVKKNKQDGCHKILDGERITCVSHAVKAALKTVVVPDSLCFGTQEMGHSQGEDNKSDCHQKLNDNRKVIEWYVIHICRFASIGQIYLNVPIYPDLSLNRKKGLKKEAAPRCGEAALSILKL
jgi:hypothetical protein